MPPRARYQNGSKESMTIATTSPPAPAPPATARMMQMIMGYWVSQMVAVAARLVLADALASGPRTAPELAAVVEADAGALARLLRALTAMGVFAEPTPGRYALTRLSDCLRTGGASSLHDLAITQCADGHWLPWG